jgi:Raf kinase inhibitor-like YbhB/YbcL family protein
MALAIQSSAFPNGGSIPLKYTGDGPDLSPPLSWSGVPPQARELVLIVDDPDAPGRSPFVHWLAYKIPATEAGLDEGASKQPPAGVVQGPNSFGRSGYGGPAPPPGKPHHYQFHLYALDHPLSVGPSLDKKGLIAAMEGHILSEAVMTGVFQRSR